MKKHEIIVKAEDKGIRIDIFIASEFPEISRSYCKKLIIDGKVLLNNARTKPSYCVSDGDIINITIDTPTEIGLIAQDIKIDIIYEDDDIIIINKARGMVVHPSHGHNDKTLVNALLFHCDKMPVIGGQLRPGIVHRIDKDTTGLLVAAKNDNAHITLSKQFKDKTAGRKYYALVEGVIKDDGEICEPIARHKKDRKKMGVAKGGRTAHTKYKIYKSYSKYTLLDVKLLTGRTHQIRVHLTHIMHPVVGDKVYGYKKQKFNLEGQLLHAYELSLKHPKTGVSMIFNAPMPEDFKSVLRKI